MEQPNQQRKPREKATATRMQPQQEQLQHVLSEVRAQMEAEFARTGASPPDSVLSHAGLRDGAQFVEEFLQAGEWGEAFHHLCYMVEQAQLSLSPKAYAALEKAGAAMRFDVARWQGKVTDLSDPPVTTVCAKS